MNLLEDIRARIKVMNVFTRKNKHYLLSLLWLVLIIFFTYTSLIHEILKTDGLSVLEYCQAQHKGISMIVNFGLLAMVVFDYIGAAKKMSVSLVVGILIAAFLVFAMYTHTGIRLSNEILEYRYPICEDHLSMVLHIIFFVILLIIKIGSMKIEQNCSDSILRVQKTF